MIDLLCKNEARFLIRYMIKNTIIILYDTLLYRDLVVPFYYCWFIVKNILHGKKQFIIFNKNTWYVYH
jgi:hypothetical protein